MPDAPATLPPDFFDQPGRGKASGATPNELPPDFFEKIKEENARPIDYNAIRRGALPMAGGIAAGLFTGGLSIPAAVGLTAAGGGMGSAIEQGIEKFRGEPEAPKTIGEAAKRTGVEAAEQGAAELGGRVVTGTLGKVMERYFNPERMYQSGLKPSGTNETKALGTVQTGIKEKVPLTERARAMVRGRITKLQDQVADIVQSSPADIPPSQYVRNVSSKLDSLRKTVGNDPVQGAQFVDHLDDMERNFLIRYANPEPIVRTIQEPAQGIVGPNGQPVMISKQITIPPDEMSLSELRQQARPLSSVKAQDIKKQAYETIRTQKPSAWDPGQHNGLTVEARQEIASALRQELEKIYPDIRKLNRRQGALIELDKQLERFTKREMNKQNLPYIPFVLGGAALGYAHGGEATTGALAGAVLKHMLENPAVKSRIAIALDEASRLPGKEAAKFVGKQIPKTAIRVGIEQAEDTPGSRSLETPK